MERYFLSQRALKPNSEDILKDTVAELNRATGLIEIRSMQTGEIVAFAGDTHDLRITPSTFMEYKNEEGETFYVQSGLPLEHIPSKKKRHILTTSLIDIICHEMVEGRSLAKICKDPSMPSRSMVKRWMDEHQWVREALDLASKHRADYMSDRAVEVADELDVESHTSEQASVARAKIDTYFKAASFGDREKFGNHTKVTGMGIK